jgi:hypothetical protein
MIVKGNAMTDKASVSLCLVVVLLLLLVSTGCRHAADTVPPLEQFRVEQAGKDIMLENGLVRVVFDMKSGTYALHDLHDAAQSLEQCTAWIGGAPFARSAAEYSWFDYSVREGTQNGHTLCVRSTYSNRPGMLLTLTLYEDQPHLVLGGGVINTTPASIRVRNIMPLAGGTAFPGISRKKNMQFLNGDGGDAELAVTSNPGLRCVNNLMATFEDAGRRRTLIAGGLTTHHYVKYVNAGDGAWAQKARRCQITESLPDTAQLRLYINCGPEWRDGGAQGPRAALAMGRAFESREARKVADPWYSTVVWHRRALEFRLTGLDPEKHYQIGFSWWDYVRNERKAACTARGNGVEKELVAPRELPDYTESGKGPEEWRVTLPPQCYANGGMTLRFPSHNMTQNLSAFVCDLWLAEADADIFEEEAAVTSPPMHITAARRFEEDDGLALTLEADDPRGRLVETGETWIPDDRFYVDITTPDPFAALEQYANVVRQAQNTNPNPYTFPTVCGGHAMIPAPGGGQDSNTSAGLVRELESAAETGFLRYAPVAVRLAPGVHEVNNEQGWWDDARWRRFGHLREPYERMSKWGPAVLERGGIPLMYLQTGRISEDYAQAYPDHMLWNDEPALVRQVVRPDGRPRSFDYTDPGFSARVKAMYAYLRRSGVKGLMFDYPDTGWRPEGGFEDPITTATAAYRRIFELAKNGLGEESWIHERLLHVTPLMPMADLSIGLADSQRVWDGTDRSTPEMYAKCGLRWYKNRRLYHYEMDAKNLFKVLPENRDGLRQMLTMTYTVSGRLLLANSFSSMTQEQIDDMSRVFPMHTEALSARPLDLLAGGGLPNIYDFPITPDWHQLVFFNDDYKSEQPFAVLPGDPPADGGMGLAPAAAYHVFDFWNDRYAGLFAGNALLEQQLRPGEARMLAVHRTEVHPQVIATNRHIMQGYLDLNDVIWDSESGILSGRAETIAAEPCDIIIACNGYGIIEGEVGPGAVVEMLPVEKAPDLFRLRLLRMDPGDTEWRVRFQPSGAVAAGKPE